MIIQPVIMSGGAGTRLWPLSRRAKPKQFLKLVTDKTMFQETALRVSPDLGGRYAAPLVIAGKSHEALVAEQLAEININPQGIILEPAARNTAAVAAIAAAASAELHGDALVLLMPADHHIADGEAFRSDIEKAALAGEDGFIATFGILPTHAHTGYGYIELGSRVSDCVYEVNAFKEKPDASTAQGYVKDGGYFWNSGIFLFKASALLAEFDEHAPDIKQAALTAFAKTDRKGVSWHLDLSLIHI